MLIRSVEAVEGAARLGVVRARGAGVTLGGAQRRSEHSRRLESAMGSTAVGCLEQCARIMGTMSVRVVCRVTAFEGSRSYSGR